MKGSLSPDLARKIGLEPNATPEDAQKLLFYINLKLRDLGCPTFPLQIDAGFADLMTGLMALNREKDRLLSNHLNPVDQRIQNFLYEYLEDTTISPRMPTRTLVLDRYGLARALSLPPDRDLFTSDIITSYRVRQGVLHNPKSDRRTTQGIFHVTEGGLPIPDDKKSVPKSVFGRLLLHAFSPPAELLRLPFTASQKEQAEVFVSLLLRPIVCPAVPGVTEEKTMEIRFFAPGNLVCNLDFVESIFGNAGDPILPENDAALNPSHWTGHTGCIILAPHLNKLTKKDLGLPQWEHANERQRRDGMCWKDANELYNDGGAFKITARDASGVIVTIISDNYFGYCKKEVKTQLSFSANLYGLCEEEHAGGALVFPSYDLGGELLSERNLALFPDMPNLDESMKLLGNGALKQPEGHYVDAAHPQIHYVPANTSFDLHKQKLWWNNGDKTCALKLLLGNHYILPNGYRLRIEKPRGSLGWRLVGTNAETTFCHKPCTVSGGGKSEISKPISDAILSGPVFVADIDKDFDAVETILARDYSKRFRDTARHGSDTRSILSTKRSLGSVIKLLTPSDRDYSVEHNQWLATIPPHVKEIVFILKRFHKPEWGDNWREHFSVDVIDGSLANELRLEGRKLSSNFLRVGFSSDDSWRTFSLRKDFHPADKIQMEDDISASVVVPSRAIKGLAASQQEPSVKMVQNCEYRLFQRPDDAIHRGYDHQTENDFARSGTFFSNYEPIPAARAKELVEEAVSFDAFTQPMQNLLRDIAENPKPSYFVCSAFPRLIDRKPSKNPRYLQVRPDFFMGLQVYCSDVALHLSRRIPLAEPAPTPVNAVLAGRRNNPAEPPAIRPLATYNPLHFMELPELFMEFICSMTGKSPSTTGAGSEGALTKGPFNALPPIYDLNIALVSFLVTGYAGYISSAGCIGPKVRVDHDVSLLVPEVWSRMSVPERDPNYLIEAGYLEKVQDFTHKDRTVLASRLGYRITKEFVTHFCGRIFNQPHSVFTDEMLRPELQDPATFVEGVENIVITQRRVSQHYFNDGSIDHACPPLRALLHIMRDDHYEGKDLQHPELRALFTRGNLLASDWYKARLAAKQTLEIAAWRQHTAYLSKFLNKTNYAEEAARLGIANRLSEARARLAKVQSQGYLEELVGTIGAEPHLLRT